MRAAQGSSTSYRLRRYCAQNDEAKTLPNSIFYILLFYCSIVLRFCISLSNVHINLGVVCSCIRTSGFTIMTVFFAVIVVNN